MDKDICFQSPSSNFLWQGTLKQLLAVAAAFICVYLALPLFIFGYRIRYLYFTIS